MVKPEGAGVLIEPQAGENRGSRARGSGAKVGIGDDGGWGSWEWLD